MSTIALSTERNATEESTQEPEVRALTSQEAQALRLKNPPLSPWRVVAGQAVVAVLVSLAALAVTGKQSVALSTAWGALAVVVPAALFARGLFSPVAKANAGAAVFAFFLWESVKIALTVAMLFAAPKLVPGLSWPAMLVGLVVTSKVYGLAVVFRKTFSAKFV